MYKKAFESKFVLPVNTDKVRFYRSSSVNALNHIFIPRREGDHRSICGFSLKNTFEVNEPEVISDICTKCLKGKYAVDEPDLPFNTELWVDYFNDLTREDSYKDIYEDLEINEIIQKQLDYEILSLNIQNEIAQCNHAYLHYVMRYNELDSIACHNCDRNISNISCECDDPITIDFVDTSQSGQEVQRDIFCMKCNSYLLKDINRYL